jgi:hypothetical protein
MSTFKPPSIPSPILGNDNSTHDVLMSIKNAVETLQKQRGSKANAAVTFQDLVDLGLINADKIPK